ncbi:hypothetical protein C1645_831135 [Glomus cerebriforme]|uniref:Beta-lactamase n=1 Tax=Glomus cerebriforme TaxID=658196 RepID=A0A397SM90_9GLOM|nr:hypothetical protein C1645_831135 [Glomus cerebriforme]
MVFKYLKSSEGGNIKAMSQYNNIAEYHLDNKNEMKAFKWYLKLVNKIKLRAIYFVAKYYRDGIGTEQNLNEAEIWYKKCLDQSP